MKDSGYKSAVDGRVWGAEDGGAIPPAPTTGRKDLVKKTCSVCSVSVLRRRSEKYKILFCSLSCRKKHLKTGGYRECSWCCKKVYKAKGVLKTSKSGRIFCSRSCATSYNNKAYKQGENNPNFIGGSSSYRVRALREQGSHCSNPNCEITEANIKIPEKLLDVDHIDNNRGNNKISNLKVLCVWCHAKKTRERW